MTTSLKHHNPHALYMPLDGGDAQARRLNAQIAMIRRARETGHYITETEANLAGLQYKPLTRA
ncbi:TPA_asm: hypothetical protein PROPHIFSQJ01-1_18 [Mycobacterium phage prophiFSQJ01-1]|nr:Uncharacterised protein [Mycobacteroides abscessus subsp. abscessus]SIK14867.1 Uncharacterised protein [Mycobacteroides abscessus subsp. abscessus]SIN24955.1 Uncharacterised protein [Mycobacteroides abscessus subsp. abscessus]SLI51965.1 Uncharacterised protein [Mycobacteroides abscessus subsp. abscessus]DAZ90304.1 TPA_asm: hypothetical protein PROPHIFSQJ01-1_18 [Mycobacterium phage prophiFSQJ01-1]